jgi:hypothetical protein
MPKGKQSKRDTVASALQQDPDPHPFDAHHRSSSEYGRSIRAMQDLSKRSNGEGLTFIGQTFNRTRQEAKKNAEKNRGGKRKNTRKMRKTRTKRNFFIF